MNIKTSFILFLLMLAPKFVCGQVDTSRKVLVHSNKYEQFVITANGYNGANTILDSISNAKNLRINLFVLTYMDFYRQSFPLPSQSNIKDMFKGQGLWSEENKKRRYNDSIAASLNRTSSSQKQVTENYISSKNLRNTIVFNLTFLQMMYPASSDTGTVVKTENFAKLRVLSSIDVPDSIKNNYL